jgi:RNA polymerase sigma factor (sigma-70 family)
LTTGCYWRTTTRIRKTPYSNACMPMPSDGELLRRYAEGSEAAFTELVQRHINLVYLAALRRVGRNAHAADDVTQKVFTDLARKARSLTDRSSMVGWLYTSTRFAAADVVRAEQRRRNHELEAQTMNELNSDVPAAMDQLEPLLDEVLDLLPEKDREAVLLHFFEGRPFPEVGVALALSADATRMRVNRALERLRAKLAQRGITSSAAALAGVLSVQSTLAAPAPLALAVAGNAISHAGALGAGLTFTGRLIEVARASRLALWTGVAVLVIVAGGLALYLRGHAETSSAPPVAFPEKSAPNLSEVPSATPPNVAAVTSPSSPENGAPAGPPPANFRFSANTFSELSDAEKNLLARLWFQHEALSAPPGTHLVLRVGALAPNASGVDPLVTKGLVTLGAQPGAIHLTKRGLMFCEKHREELLARPLTGIGPAKP